MSLFQKLCVTFGLQSPHANARHPGSGKGDPNRILTRKRQRLQDGFVCSERMLAPRPCTLRDMTVLGASVEIWDKSTKPAMLAGPLTLYIPADRKEVTCAVMWRENNVVGLKFTSPFRAPTRSYG